MSNYTSWLRKILSSMLPYLSHFFTLLLCVVLNPIGESSQVFFLFCVFFHSFRKKKKYNSILESCFWQMFKKKKKVTLQLFVFYIHNAFSFSDISYAHCNSLILPLVSYCSFCHMNSFFWLVARAFMERREGCFATQNNCRFQVLKYRFVSAFPGFLSGGRIQLASLSTSIFCATSVHVWCYALNVIIVFFHSNLAGEKNWLGAPCVRFFPVCFLNEYQL